MIDLKDYNETGYVVIENWLNQEECKKFLLDYQDKKILIKEQGTGIELTFASVDLIKEISSKIYNVCDAVNRITDQSIDQICPNFAGSNWYANNSLVNWEWHQDLANFFTQSYKDYIILYIILSKEDENQSGLDVIPVNRLKEHLSNEQFNKIFDGQGSKGFIDAVEYNKKIYEESKGVNWPEWEDFMSADYLDEVKKIDRQYTLYLDPKMKTKTEIAVKYLTALAQQKSSTSAKTLVSYNLTDEIEHFTFDINDLKESPKLKSGDLLLMRGDLIHKTQDQNTKRIALSTRCINGNSKMFASYKYKNFKGHKNFYHDNKDMLKSFEKAFDGEDEKTVREIYSNVRRTLDGRQ